MGTYVYAVRRKNIEVSLPSGDVVTAFLLKYLYKPSYSRPRHNIAYEAVVARIERDFERANQTPQYVVFVDERPEEGDQVRSWTGQIRCHDGSGKLPGDILGWLKRNGRKWVVTNENPLVKKPPAYSS